MTQEESLIGSAVKEEKDDVTDTQKAIVLDQNDVSNESKQASKKVEAASAPLVFVDPVGTRWTFPYDACKTWDDMKALIKRVFVDIYMHQWYIDQFDEATGCNNTVAIMSLEPDKTCILVESWEQMVRPGWKITIEFRGKEGILDEILTDIRNKKAEQAANEEADEKEPEPVPTVDSDVSYAIQLYQQDGSSYPEYLRAVTCEKPPGYHFQEGSGKQTSIIHEVRKLFLGQAKRDGQYEYDGQLSNGDILGRCVLHIYSPILLNALKAIIQFQNATDEPGDQKFSVSSEEVSSLDQGVYVYPFRDLYHHKDKLEEYKNSPNGCRAQHSEEYTEECGRHIDVLINYLYEQQSIRLRDAEAMWGRPVPTTTFNWLWLLLKPGSVVYVPERGVVNAYIIESVRGGPRGQGSNARAQPYTVDIWNLDFNGKVLGRSQKSIQLPVFDGEREIRSLRLYPARFHEDKEGEKPHQQRLIERGKKFIEAVKVPTFQEYSGPSQFHGSRTFNHSRVIVDQTSQPWEDEIDQEQANMHWPGPRQEGELGSLTRIPACQCAQCEYEASKTSIYHSLAFDDYDDIDLHATTTLSDDQYMLCFSHVYAYALQDRLWDLLDVEGLKAPRIDRDVINTLVMRPESNKAMVKAICETYGQKQERENLFFADFIRGKGEGQVMLLHGPPGTGKTLTAESIAEYTQRPLLSITAADLGHEPDLLEKNLLRFFRNATKWDAIVLLDEADVFLERRSANDLRRNSIVSVFLRALDYFQGILFLTTNRVGSFDEAFMSRIHLQIGYAPLDDSARLQVWNNSFKKLSANHKQGGKEIQYSFSAKEYVKSSKTLHSLRWNGREIRNAFQTAVALASFEAKQSGEQIPTVTEDHISQVVDMSSTFKDYMKSALQANDADIAYRDRLRNDRFKLVPMSDGTV
ncbi:hypothetical protein SLS55_006156 [Diplodia seriata]|uniref:AAA+ ATPase domain-containing protein n=2 Tax=Diplodia seriata TaxID=420778 RepID=A0ABR3CDE1_9PEZI